MTDLRMSDLWPAVAILALCIPVGVLYAHAALPRVRPILYAAAIAGNALLVWAAFTLVARPSWVGLPAFATLMGAYLLAGAHLLGDHPALSSASLRQRVAVLLRNPRLRGLDADA
ncbi:hypothetical protein [Propioniciclava soli]|uniref:DUF4175 domain-containing protein n=1 Tax=Propioniciclava soli TaxID=2775081 RepID=A0ABZ3C4A1_9ACTN|nr:hypothetical protein [Propioniciclava soli]